jgi:hypothetical protein
MKLNEEHDFAKLLRDAPMAPDADTVTVVGTLARTHDAAHFMLTLPDGRSVTLEVNAVKSAKTIAGAIGQSVVQMELDAKRIPESVRDLQTEMHNFYSPPVVDYTVVGHHEGTNPRLDQPHQQHMAELYKWRADVLGTGFVSDVPNGPVKVLGDHGSLQKEVIETGGVTQPAWFAQPAPFVAAMPHQASLASIDALMQGVRGTQYQGAVLKNPYEHLKSPYLEGTSPLYGQLDY